MLRRIRIRLNPAHPPRRTSSSAAFAHALEEQHTVPYGVAYGAGPSRIPYQPPSYSFTGRAQGHEAARFLREKLSSLSHGSYAAPQAFAASLVRSIEGAAQKTQVRTNEVVPSLSRLQLHTVVHHLIREKKAISHRPLSFRLCRVLRGWLVVGSSAPKRFVSCLETVQFST